MIEQAVEVSNSTPSVLLAWFVLCVVAVGAFALQCLWILVLQPFFGWLSRL